jgi:hypothetical protein
VGDHVDKSELQKKAHLDGDARGGQKGCCTKCFAGKFPTKHHGNYRNNGYHNIKGNPLKTVFYEPAAARLKKFPLQKEEQFGITDGKKNGKSIKVFLMPSDPNSGLGWGFSDVPKGFSGKKNYQNANVPFAHQYHHMIPWEALSAGAFETFELKFLQMAEYNLNDGFNLIVLPMRKRVAEILRMYTHPNDHPDYSLEVSTVVTNVKSKMATPKKHLDKKSAKVMKQTLENWEKPEFVLLMKDGIANYPDHVNERKPTSMAKAYRQAMKQLGMA